MKRHSLNFEHLYQKALRTHLEQGRRAGIESAKGLGIQALAAGLPTLDLAKLHERTLVMDLLPSYPARKRPSIIKQAGTFFAAAIAPISKSEYNAQEALRVKKIIGTLSDRTVELAAANLQLTVEISHRRKAEGSLKRSERKNVKSSVESNVLKDQLRALSRQILTTQEDERKKISRELHDVVAQALMGINVRLANLKTEAGNNTKGLGRSISLTQKMVTKSANIVHEFARELRPTALDDLGLIPALQSYMKSFTARTGVRTHLIAFAGVEKIDSARRTVLYRVAQEALTNVGRHAHAHRVEVIIRKGVKSIHLEIRDDGKSFQVQSVLLARGNKRLGLLGMRERVEMVGGTFNIESVAGRGTSIIALIPIPKATVKKWVIENEGIQPEVS
jgi:signal transduction histidine kinase